MLKLLTVLAASLAVGVGAVPSRSASGDQAIQNVLAGDLAFKNQTIGISSDQILTAEEKTGDYVVLTDRIKSSDDNGNDKTVTINWDITSTKDLYSASKMDKEHTLIQFNFPEKGEQAQFFNFKVKSLKCGLTTYKPQEGELVYSVQVNPRVLEYDSMTVSEATAVVDGKFAKVQYDGDSAGFPANNPEVDEYYHTKVRGKVVYLAGDGNWGLIADGKSYLEIYAGSELNLNSQRYPALKVGNWVEIQGDFGFYLGNMQLSYITAVRKLDNHKGMKNPQGATKLSAKNCAAIVGHQCVDGLMNSMRTVKGSYIPGTLRNSSNQKVSPEQITAVARYTFDFDVGSGAKIQIAFDYHIARDAQGASDLKHEVIKKLNDILAHPGKTYTISGTARYSRGDGNTDKNWFGDDGVWNIVPLEKSATGCGGSIVAASGISAMGTTLGALMLLLKKRKED